MTDSAKDDEIARLRQQVADNELTRAEYRQTALELLAGTRAELAACREQLGAEKRLRLHRVGERDSARADRDRFAATLIAIRDHDALGFSPWKAKRMAGDTLKGWPHEPLPHQLHICPEDAPGEGRADGQVFTSGDVPACIRCGCTDEQACPGGCSWVPGSMEGDLCSRCVGDGDEVFVTIRVRVPYHLDAEQVSEVQAAAEEWAREQYPDDEDDGKCCDLHGRNCEPPSELCCDSCTEARHAFWADARGVQRFGHLAGEECSNPDLSAVTREGLIVAATGLHDREGCSCDRKYLMSCPNMASAILRSGPGATDSWRPGEGGVMETAP